VEDRARRGAKRQSAELGKRINVTPEAPTCVIGDLLGMLLWSQDLRAVAQSRQVQVHGVFWTVLSEDVILLPVSWGLKTQYAVHAAFACGRDSSTGPLLALREECFPLSHARLQPLQRGIPVPMLAGYTSISLFNFIPKTCWMLGNATLCPYLFLWIPTLVCITFHPNHDANLPSLDGRTHNFGAKTHSPKVVEDLQMSMTLL